MMFNRHSLLLLCGMAGVAAGASWNTRAEPAPEARRPAVTAYLNERGQAFLSKHFGEILASGGVKVDRGAVGKFQWNAPEPTRLDRLSPRFQPHVRTLQGIKAALSEWLVGFSLNDPWFRIDFQNASYRASGISYDFQIDPAPRDAGGILVRLDLSIPRLRIEAASFRASDTANAFLGRFGLDKPWFELNDPGRPLRLTLISRVQVRPDGSVDFECLSAASNIDELQLQSGFARLVLPKVEFRLGGQKSALATAPIEAVARARKDQLVKMGQIHVKDWIQTYLPRHVNERVKPKLAAGFGMGLPIDPVPTPENLVIPFGTISPVEPPPLPDGEKLQLRLALGHVSALWGRLKMGLGGEVADPSFDPASGSKAPAVAGTDWSAHDIVLGSAPTLPGGGEGGAPRSVDFLDHDLDVTLDLQVFNQVLSRSFERGSLRVADIGKGGELKLVTAPVMVPHPDGAEGLVRMRCLVEVKPADLQQKIAFKGPFHLEVELDVSARVSKNGKSFDLVRERIVPGTARIPRRFYRAEALGGLIEEGLADEIATRNFMADPDSDDVALSKGISLAATPIFGVPFWIWSVRFDPSGALVAGLRFDR